MRNKSWCAVGLSAMLSVLLVPTAAWGAINSEPVLDGGDDGGGGTSTSSSSPNADFNGDGNLDKCLVPAEDSIQCKVDYGESYTSTSTTNITYSKKVDPGWMAGRAWVDHNGDGKADYCRVVDYTRLACTVSTAPETPGWSYNPGGTYFDSTTGFGETYYSNNLDAGWDDTRVWVDANGDGKIDYCRVVGNIFTGFSTQCTLSTGTGFQLERTISY